MYSEERPRTPPPSKDKRHNPSVSKSGFCEPFAVKALASELGWVTPLDRGDGNGEDEGGCIVVVDGNLWCLKLFMKLSQNMAFCK